MTRVHREVVVVPQQKCRACWFCTLDVGAVGRVVFLCCHRAGQRMGEILDAGPARWHWYTFFENLFRLFGSPLPLRGASELFELRHIFPWGFLL